YSLGPDSEDDVLPTAPLCRWFAGERDHPGYLLVDSSGNSRNLYRNAGTTTYARRGGPNPKKSAYKLSFSGTGQYGSMPHHASLEFTSSNAYTVVSWVETDHSDGGYVLSKMDATPDGWGVTIEPNGRLQHVQLVISSGNT